MCVSGRTSWAAALAQVREITKQAKIHEDVDDVMRVVASAYAAVAAASVILHIVVAIAADDEYNESSQKE